ncbi:hypothetical protein ACJX0J_038598, partial [Zea mays]
MSGMHVRSTYEYIFRKKKHLPKISDKLGCNLQPLGGSGNSTAMLTRLLKRRKGTNRLTSTWLESEDKIEYDNGEQLRNMEVHTVDWWYMYRRIIYITTTLLRLEDAAQSFYMESNNIVNIIGCNPSHDIAHMLEL